MSLLPAQPSCALPEQQPAAPVVSEDPHHPPETWVVVRMEMGPCDQHAWALEPGKVVGASGKMRTVLLSLLL